MYHPSGIKRLAIIIFGLIFISYFVVLFATVPVISSRTETILSPPPEKSETIPPPIHTATLKIKKNDTIFTLLSSFDVSPYKINEVISSSKNIYDLKTIKTDADIKFFLEGNEFRGLKLPIDGLNYIIIEKKEDKFIARKEPIEYKTIFASAKGTIKNSLYEDAVSSGVDPDVIMNLSDIFAWEIDFTSEVREGDTFKVLYEKRYLEDRFVKNGRILAAQFENNGKLYHAIYFKSKDGKDGYYDLNGNALSRQFLKSPLNFRRISSYFSRSRFHPIQRTYRPHHGIDYSAPMGTPIVTTGGGRIEFIGWKSGYGKVIVIKHNNTYKTMYGHLNSFAKGIKTGGVVKQGQVIGYVGSTGLSTGPHLHYEVRKSGTFINPLKMNISYQRVPVSARYIQDFKGTRDDLMRGLMAGVITVAQKDTVVHTD
ncbi:MAG: M23 family metallopeptidase [Deltaproteobacteria bacterium]|nr:M23 family metallopeptidase [Deltaproteobacteria bacterium]